MQMVPWTRWQCSLLWKSGQQSTLVHWSSSRAEGSTYSAIGEMDAHRSHCLGKRRKPMQRPATFAVPLFFFFFYLVPSVWGQQMPSSDTQALIRFKQQIKVDPTGYVNNSWNVASLDARGCPENWYGVDCSDQGSVTSVILENLALQGELISGTLGSLFELLHLSLSNNSFRGNLPDDFWGLSKIITINLADNGFEGPTPGSLVNLPSLTNLSLSGNGLIGSIPSGLAMNLQQLDLSRNKLEGLLPSSLTQLQQLAGLNLSSNNLEGSVPDGFQNLLHLETLDLHGNQLSGSIDPALLALNITYVDLSSNNFTGRLPWQSFPSINYSVVEYVNLSHNHLSDTFSNFPVVFAVKLLVLDISGNQLTGELPFFEYTSALKTLRLHDNALSGSIPATLLQGQSLSLLTELDLSANQLTGNVQAITSNMLTTIDLSRNMLTGTLPSSLGQCQSLNLSSNNFYGGVQVMESWGGTLQKLDLSNNQLTGPLFSGDLNLFYQLIYLNLSRNMLSGPIPEPFGSSQVLSVIDLSFNEFEGGVPVSFFHSSLASLLLSNNQFSGRIPLSDLSSPSSAPVSPSHLQILADSSPLSPLVVLDLSSNSLNGSIPGKVGSISTLKILNLSDNNLSGQIPPQFDELSSLQDLDLSENQLSGSLPSALPKSLIELNVSRNDLSGPIPSSLTRFPQSSFFPQNGNTALIWPGPPKSSPGVRHKNSKDSKSKVKAGLIGGITAGAVLVVAIGILIYIRRSLKSKKGTRTPEFAETQKDLEKSRTVSHTAPEFEGNLEHGAPNVSAVTAAGNIVHSKKGKNSPSKIVSPKPKVENDIVQRDAGPADNHHLPSVTGAVLSPGHPLASKVSPEHPIEEKGQSNEMLMGDVFFLDKTLSFSAAELSRAPIEVLGRSNHGTSYKAILDDDHVLVVKWLKVDLAKSRKEFGMEAKKFGNIKHQNIVSVKGYYWGPREHEKLILSEYIIGVSLANRLLGCFAVCAERTELSQPPLTWPQRLKVAVDVSRGLMYLHTKHHWAHGNIKASNILLTEDSNFEVLLSDYGLHQLMTSAGIENQVINSGALGYCAPELSDAKKPKPSMKSDVFSFGVILMELITGKSAGDIVSASIGIVDFSDWVKVVANEGHAIDCYDTALVGVDRDLEPPKGMDLVLALSLSCVAPQSSRPSMGVVHEGLAAINPD